MIYKLDDLSPDVHADTWVAESAAVIGQVVLAAGVSVWFNAVLRAENAAIILVKTRIYKMARSCMWTQGCP